MKSLLILGRQPALGLAELESLYGATVMQLAGPDAVLLSIEPGHVDFARLGGSIKLAHVLTELPSTNWRDVETYLSRSIPKSLQGLPDGKLKLGLSAYGLRASASDLNATGLRLKRAIKDMGHSVRVVPNKTPVLNSAQVLHNQLTGALGVEIVAYRNGSKTLIAQTVAEQDIESYARRDQNRPMRDAKVGMLPPKLAQILINLTAPSAGAIVLDPFCGTGVVLQEAMLMGYEPYGTDIEPRMIEYSDVNLHWFEDKLSHRRLQAAAASEPKHNLHPKTYHLELGDATTHTWSPTPAVVAAETYLGKPLSREPDETLLHQIMQECDQIHTRTLENLARQLPPGTRLCLAVPAWKLKKGFQHLKTLDFLQRLGYTRMEFKFAKRDDLIYFREDQIVARELVVLQKN